MPDSINTNTDFENDKRKFPNLFNKNGLETEIENYTESALSSLNFSIILKPIIISVVAVFISLFLDISRVPILGNVTIDIAQYLFPNWQQAEFNVVPFEFWWLPIIVFLFFILLAYFCFEKLKKEVHRSPATETIDRIVSAYTSVIDSISTALPLIGAAILLISIKLGQDVFLGLSVPFEIKSLIVLAIGKLFEPVLDQFSVDFQNIVTNVQSIKDRYFIKLQQKSSQSSTAPIGSPEELQEIASLQELLLANQQKFSSLMENTSNASMEMVNSFNSLSTLLDKISSSEAVSSEKINELKTLSESISMAASSLNEERTIIGLKHLDSMISKNKD